MILSFINIRKVLREELKASGFARGYQHFPQDLANVNEWRIMFDPSIDNICLCYYLLSRLFLKSDTCDMSNTCI